MPFCRVPPSTARLCPCAPLWARIVANTANYACVSLHQREQHSQCVVKFLAFLRSAAIDLPAIASYHSLTDGHAVTTRRPDHFALPHRRAVGWRGAGRGLEA